MRRGVKLRAPTVKNVLEAGQDFGGMSLNACSRWGDIGLLRCPVSLILQIGLAWQWG